MRVTSVHAVFVREVVAPRLFGDAGFQGAFHNVAAEIIRARILPRFKQRVRFAQADI